MDIVNILQKEGYIRESEDNLIHAEKAFFAARVIKWIKNKAQTQADFNLQAYLTMLYYYKTGVADLKFEENEDKLVYRMKNSDQEVRDIVSSLIESFKKPVSESSDDREEETSTPEDADGTPDP